MNELEIVSVSEARKKWAELLEKVCVNKKPIYITKHGKIIAKIEPIEEDK